jgi:hypothetical protein
MYFRLNKVKALSISELYHTISQQSLDWFKDMEPQSLQQDRGEE